ncbi:MAG: VIT and vWA domain-containing protein [Pirellulales bacterium]
MVVLKRFTAFAALVALVGSLAMVQSVSAQAVVVIHHSHLPVPLPRPIHRPPTPPASSYKITELAVNARLMDQVAKVQVSQTFQNTGSRQMEVSFIFPLPYDGAIDSLTLLVDGKEFAAKLLPKDKARKIYEDIVRSNKDPALLEWVGTGMFQTSVFPVPAGAERTVSITYNQLLRKDGRLTDFVFPLSTAKYTDRPLEKLTLSINLESNEKLKSIYSPTHTVEVDRKNKNRATVTFEAKNIVPMNDFRLFFDTAKESLSASVLTYKPSSTDEGYFLMLASPQFKTDIKDQPKKTVVFVVDRSGSMSGEKIEQAKEAAKFVLNNLRDGDTFNVIAYDSDVESFAPELQKVDEKSRRRALDFVDGLYAGGSTNIDGALNSALSMIADSTRPNYLLFLTDGKPTHGETNEGKIVENAKGNNDLRTRVISFGVGYDVNSRLLDRLSRECFGQSEYVRPNEDIEEHVARLYRKISSPVMTDVKINYDMEDASGSFVNRVMPKEVYDLFEGEQIVIAGRYKKSGNAKITITGNMAGKKQKYDFPAKFVEKSRDQSNSFVSKIWAMRRIGEIIDEVDLHGKNNELIQELVQLSTEHGIITPYTSFLADENQTVRDLADSVRGGRLSLGRANESTEELKQIAGKEAFSQRAAKSFYQNNAQVPAAATRSALADAVAEESRSGRFGAGGGGYGADDNGVRLSGLASNSASYRDTKNDKDVVVSSVRNVGNKTIFHRRNYWFAEDATDIDPEKDKDKYEEIERFSKRYFELVTRNTKDENLMLSQQKSGEQLVVKLRSKYYLIK